MPQMGVLPLLAHAGQHEDGGYDEIDVQGLPGLLADAQDTTWAQVADKPVTFPPEVHAADHENGGPDEIDVQGLSGLLLEEQTSAWSLVSGKPATFPPEAHASKHQDGGSDEISVAALSGLLADAQTPLAHGAEKHTDRLRSFWMIPQALINATMIGVGFVPWAVCTDTKQADAYFSAKVPSDFVSLVDVYVIWFATAAAGNLYWSIFTSYFAPGESRAAHQENVQNILTATGGDLIVNATSPGVTAFLTLLDVNDFVGIFFRRRGDQAADTLNVDVNVMGVLITYTADM